MRRDIIWSHDETDDVAIPNIRQGKIRYSDKLMPSAPYGLEISQQN